VNEEERRVIVHGVGQKPEIYKRLKKQEGPSE
jgi:hypothetical protein